MHEAHRLDAAVLGAVENGMRPDRRPRARIRRDLRPGTTAERAVGKQAALRLDQVEKPIGCLRAVPRDERPDLE
jgi:hypothetical protein